MMKVMKYRNQLLTMLGVLICGGLILVSPEAAASNFGKMADSITKTFTNIGLMITGGSYIGGLAFSIGAIMQFKQHKDNPTQVTIGKPISLVFIAAALLFLPTILSITGQSMFGGKGSTAGPTGVTISS
jgi:intracellular multiplication protein IcmD